MAQNYGEIAKYTAILAVGYVAVKVALSVKDALAKGADGLKAAGAEAKKIVTQDLNPTSDKNLAYRAVNALAGKDNVTDSVGTSAQAAINGDPYADQLAAEKNAATAADSSQATAQDAFRRQELGIDQTPSAAETFRQSELLDFKNSSGVPDEIAPGVISVGGQIYSFQP